MPTRQKLTSKQVKNAALRLGADLVGIGLMSRFEGAPRNSDPRFMFPEAKSVIGLGFRIHRGLLRPMEEGTHWGTYPSLGYANINDVHMPVVMRELGSFTVLKAWACQKKFRKRYIIET